jgi:hypothetical protein
MFCQSGERASRHGGFSSVLAEITSLVLARRLPFLSWPQRQRLERAGRYGRIGLDCSAIYDSCEEQNWNFVQNAESFTSSTVGSYNHVEKLLTWAMNKLQ